jgi:glutaminyl-tRNA synthetase
MAAAERKREPGSWLDPSVKKSALEARKLDYDWDVTTPEQDAEHKAINKNVVRTRFPPEPNGYLHIGHAKSMNMNFSLAFEKLGVPVENRETYFRFDDTNPEAESKEYIDNIKEDVAWMGWSPVKNTFASDLFPQLHQLAIQLVKSGKCYVCFQTSEEIEECREVAKKIAQARSRGLKQGDGGWPQGNCLSPWRDTSIEENLRLFEDMRKGKYDEGVACLRMKMDMSSSNMNMFDQVAYRVKYAPHPHAGSGWCIYPTYDFTHCVQDSLEHIDFSICTLEFETRRESYYWLLDALNLFKPMVYEMSRLNIEYVVLSKRKLIHLVNNKIVRGWDDPRMPTIKGLRRRGYTPSALNHFCSDIGVTRNENLIEYARMEEIIRQELDSIARRVMCVLKPIKVTITEGYDHKAQEVLQVPDFPQKHGSPTHPLKLTPTFYMDASDFKKEDVSSYFGLAPDKWVGLKYAGCIKCLNFTCDDSGAVVSIEASYSPLPPDGKRPRGNVHWVPDSAVSLGEVRLYDHLFTVPFVTTNWENELNPHSEVIIKTALVDPSILESNGALPLPESHFQFERVGVFVVDKDTSTEGKLIVNRTVPLKVSKSAQQQPDSEKAEKRKAEQAAALELKKAMEKVDPKDMFKIGNEKEKYSAWDKDGVPTHDAKGVEISKSAIKKLKKDWVKQKKLFEKNN